jgi:signal transduction histidine kinase
VRDHQIVEPGGADSKPGKHKARRWKCPHATERAASRDPRQALRWKPLAGSGSDTPRRVETVRQDFVSSISHELHTPPASLKALAEILQEGALADPPAARRFLNQMQIEVDALTQIVHNLLELCRIESGHFALQRSSVDTYALLHAERAHVALCIYCPGNLPRVHVDPQGLGQAPVNLIQAATSFCRQMSWIVPCECRPRHRDWHDARGRLAERQVSLPR